MVLSKTLSQVVYYKSNSQFYEMDPIKIIGVDGGDFGRAKGGRYGGGRGQKWPKIGDVVYGWPLTLKFVII